MFVIVHTLEIQNHIQPRPIQNHAKSIHLCKTIPHNDSRRWCFSPFPTEPIVCVCVCPYKIQWALIQSIYMINIYWIKIENGFTLPYVEIHVRLLADSPTADSICDDNCVNAVYDGILCILTKTPKKKKNRDW